MFSQEMRAKVKELRENGVEPWPTDLRVEHVSTDLQRKWFGVETPDQKNVVIGGRVMFRNHMGKAMFLRIQDRGEPWVMDGKELGGRIQLYIKKDSIGDAVFEQMKRLDIGDWVWATGDLMRTKTGELTVAVTEIRLASKILNTFPDRWNSVSDVQIRARQRYIDLFMNEETRETFKKRSRVVRYLRDFFESRDFMEVETPMMQVIPGGAAARPFVTHHNTLDLDLYLRIAPELYLKRLVVGGFERVFELNRNFRNEGISVKHNPEFTMLEFYQAWSTYEDLMDLSETLLSGLAVEITGDMKVVYGDRTLDFTPPFRRAPMDVLIAEQTGLSVTDLQDVVTMRAFWIAKNLKTESMPSTVGKWWEMLFEHYVEGTLVNPTFVTGFPAEISPLARRTDNDPERTDRFELIVNGWEIANGFSELADPIDQDERFTAQSIAKAAGDAEAMHSDADYVRALSYGLPPTAGQGIGIDRLVMLLTGKTSIREVILFPVMRPE
jgi:lysyl-tRNA synthetase class 2